MEKTCINCRHSRVNNNTSEWCNKICLHNEKFEPVFVPSYRIIKPISGRILIELDETVQSSIDSFIKEFGYYDEIEWTEEVENWCIKHNWIHHFKESLQRIEQIGNNEFDFDNNYYCFQGNHCVYIIVKEEKDLYRWEPINRKKSQWSGNYITALEAWNDVTVFKKRSFKSLKEVAEFYNL